MSFQVVRTKTLSKLQARSAAAIDLVTRTIERLKDTNAAISDEVANTQSAIEHLHEHETELRVLSAKNTNIINNFTRLIEGDTEN